MNQRIKLLQILSILILFSLSACELLSENNDDCDDTKMGTTEEPSFKLITYLKLDARISVHSPEKIVLSGKIYKVYCSGKESGNYSYNPTYIIDNTTNIDNEGFSVTIPAIYTYKFDNTQDKVVVMFSAQVHGKDGTVFESSAIVEEYHFGDIKYNSSELMHYLLVRSTKTVTWYEVNP